MSRFSGVTQSNLVLLVAEGDWVILTTFLSIYRQEYYHDPIGNGVVSQEVVYIANATTLIMGVQVLTPPRLPQIEGLGTNQVTVRLESRPGLGFNSTITLYGPWEF